MFPMPWLWASVCLSAGRAGLRESYLTLLRSNATVQLAQDSEYQQVATYFQNVGLNKMLAPETIELH